MCRRGCGLGRMGHRGHRVSGAGEPADHEQAAGGITHAGCASRIPPPASRLTPPASRACCRPASSRRGARSERAGGGGRSRAAPPRAVQPRAAPALRRSAVPSSGSRRSAGCTASSCTTGRPVPPAPASRLHRPHPPCRASPCSCADFFSSRKEEREKEAVLLQESLEHLRAGVDSLGVACSSRRPSPPPPPFSCLPPLSSSVSSPRMRKGERMGEASGLLGQGDLAAQLGPRSSGRAARAAQLAPEHAPGFRGLGFGFRIRHQGSGCFGLGFTRLRLRV
jgi:hypothetical protein